MTTATHYATAESEQARHDRDVLRALAVIEARIDDTPAATDLGTSLLFEEARQRVERAALQAATPARRWFQW